MSKKNAIILSGYFSPMHIGHLDMIEDAAARADFVIVVVNNNDQQMAKKGKVIIDEADRLRIVEALRVVDHAFIAVDDDRTVSASLEKVAREFGDVYSLTFANGGDRKDGSVVPETDVCDRHGITMVFDMGGTEKRDSSSRINAELGLETETSAPPSATS